MGAVRGGGFVLGSRAGRWIAGVDWAANVTNTIGAIGECIWVWSNKRFFSSVFLLTNMSSLFVLISLSSQCYYQDNHFHHPVAS
jgi:hemolysin-activating ACP:hemolysin acyltransferase